MFDLAQEKSISAVAHVYKTTVPPLMKDCHAVDGTFEAAFMGKRAHVLALNAVSRHLAGVQVHSHETHHTSHLHYICCRAADATQANTKSLP